MNVDAVGRRVDDLLDQIAARDDVAAELTEDLVRELMALYAAGLGRVLDRLRTAAPDALGDLATDPLVGGLLILHDLHPDDTAARVEAALEQVRPYLASHGGGVQLLDVADGVATLRLEGSCDGCGSSQVTLQHAVEGAVLEAAPEIERLDVAGVSAPAVNGLIPAESLSRRRDASYDQQTAWEALPTSVAADADGDTVTALAVDGAALALVRLGGQLYAYRDACPRCAGSLAGGRVHGDLVDCPACSTVFDGRRAGRAADGGRGLDPVPLLNDAAGPRVAVGAVR